MAFLITLLMIPFLVIAFAKMNGSLVATNPISQYFQYEVQILLQYGSSLLIVFVLIVIASVFLIKFEIHSSFTKKLRYSFLHTGVAFFLAGIASFFVLLLLALLQLNVMSLLLKINPQIPGVTRDPVSVYQKLTKVRVLPEIITTDSNSTSVLLALAKATSGQDAFYGKFILSSIPHFSIIPPPQSNSSLVLLDNIVIVSEISPTSIEPPSPILGYLLVKNYFRNRPTRYYPKVSIMNRDEYLMRRTKDSNEKVESLTTQIKTIQQLSSSHSAVLEKERESVATSSALLADLKKQRSTSYNRCLSEGILQGSAFIRTNTKEYCQQEQQVIDTQITNQQSTSELFKKNVEKQEALVTQYQNYEKFFKQQQLILQKSKANFPHELGAFDPKDTVKIALDSTSTQITADYLETLVHEYLHYASYQSEKKKFTELFFEEGLTEYFARKIISDGIHVETNLGYPVFVKIITQMTHLIPESEFADFYFQKNQEELEKALNRVYGDDFYQKNKILFLGLQYAVTKEQLLTLGNQIMNQIGGQPLTEKDLMSSFSTF